MKTPPRCDLVHDLVLPTLLFAALGGMTWAVRGTTGFGGTAGCIFAGLGWGTAWWFIAREPGGKEQSRRYASGWIVLALTIGVGLSGARGWAQWSTFFEGKLQTDTAKGEFVPIDRIHGFIWLFIAGMPWGGVGACLLAWCGSLRESRAWHWALRIALGVGGAFLARFLFDRFPQFFLPMYNAYEARYRDLEHNWNLRRLVNDNGAAIMHMGLYLGLLAFEILRRDWKNIVLILTVGVVSGAGWSLLQNWKWAPGVFGDVKFNWWRCWESSGGVAIGLAYGLAYFLANRRMSDREGAIVRSQKSISGPNIEWLVVYLGLTGLLGVLVLAQSSGYGEVYISVAAAFGVAYYLIHQRGFDREPAPPSPSNGDPNLERLGVYLALLIGLGFSIRNGLEGGIRIRGGSEEYWSPQLWKILGPVYLMCILAICGRILFRPLPRNFSGDVFPHADKLMWIVLFVQNAIAQFVTGPIDQWNQFVFKIYYLLLFAITAVIVIHYSQRARRSTSTPKDA